MKNESAQPERLGGSEGIPSWLRIGWMVSLVLWGAGAQVSEGIAAVGLVLCAVLVGVDVRRRRLSPLPAAKKFWPLGLFVLWALLGPLLGGRVPTGTGASRTLVWLGIPIAAHALWFVGAEARRRVGLIVLGIFLLSCVAAGLQSFGIWPPLSWFAPLHFTRIPFWRVYEHVHGTAHRFMGGGLIFHRLKFAEVGSLVVICAWVWGLRAEGVARWLGLAAGAAGLLSIVAFPFARAAMVGLVGAVILVSLLAARRRAVALLLAGSIAVAGGASVLLIRPLRARFATSLTERGSGDRDYLFDTGLAAVKAHPVLGMGLGQFRPGLFATASTPEAVVKLHAKSHDEYLTYTAETGVIGLLLYLLMLGWLARELWRAGPMGTASLGALAFFVLISFLHDPLFHPATGLMLMLVLGLGFARPLDALE